MVLLTLSDFEKIYLSLMSKLNNSQSIWLVYALLLLDVLKIPEYVSLNS